MKDKKKKKDWGIIGPPGSRRRREWMKILGRKGGIAKARRQKMRDKERRNVARRPEDVFRNYRWGKTENINRDLSTDAKDEARKPKRKPLPQGIKPIGVHKPKKSRKAILIRIPVITPIDSRLCGRFHGRYGDIYADDGLNSPPLGEKTVKLKKRNRDRT